MNRAIEQYMAQGYSRVQAIKLFYEKVKNQKSTVSATPTGESGEPKRSTNRLSTSFQAGKVKFAIERFNANKNAEIVGPEVKRSESKGWGSLKSKLLKGGNNRSLGAVALAARKNALAEAAAKEQRQNNPDLHVDTNHEHSPSREEGVSHTFGQGSPKNHGSLKLGDNGPLSVGRPLNLVPMSQIHRKFFPLTSGNGDPNDPQDDEDEDEDDDESLDTAEPSPENVMAFLHSVKYSNEERDEFLNLIDKGRDIDEAAHIIFLKRIRAYEKAGQDMVLKPGERLPLRYSSMTGNRTNDLEVLIRRDYTLPQANYICDIIYAWEKGAMQAPPPLKPTLGTLASTGKVALAVQKFSSLRKNKSGSAVTGTVESAAENNLAKKAILQAAKVNQDETHGTSTPPTPVTSSPSASSKSIVPSPLEINEYEAEEEEEAMRMAMLIAEQEEIYGINMYDCIDHADEEQIEHLCSLGMTMDEAIYHIFDEKVVRRGERPSTPASNTPSHNSNTPSNNSNTASVSMKNKTSEPIMKPQELAEEFEEPEADPEQVTQDLELEIALIMKKGGLTREAAVKHLLHRTESEVMEGSRSVEATTPSRNSTKSRGSASNDEVNNYSYPTTMGQVNTKSGSSSVGSQGSKGSRGNNSRGSSNASSRSSPTYRETYTPPASVNLRSPPITSSAVNAGIMTEEHYQQQQLPPRPSAMQHQSSQHDYEYDETQHFRQQQQRRPSAMQHQEYGYDEEFDEIWTASIPENSNNNRGVPMLSLPQEMVEDELPYTEIEIDADQEDDISHLTDPSMSVPGVPQNYQAYGHPPNPQPSLHHPYANQSPYANQPPPSQQQYTQHPPQPQFTQYPPQPPQQHIYVNTVQRQEYRPRPPRPPIIHINPQAPLLPMQYNTNLPQHLHIYNRQDDRTLSNIDADERAYRIGLLVSEQEAQYGINMYDDIHAGDEPFLNRLIQAGYNEDEAVLVIFEIKHGPPIKHYVSTEPQPMQRPPQPPAAKTPQPPQRPAPIIHINSNSSNMSSPSPYNHQPASTPYQYAPPSSPYVPSPAPPQRGIAHNNSQTSHHQSQRPPVTHTNSNNSMDSLEFAMQLSRQENEYHPGAVRMPGMNASNRNNASTPHHRPPPSQSQGLNHYSDVDPNKLRTLTSMGFETEAAYCALISNNLDVDQALDFLLGNN